MAEVTKCVLIIDDDENIHNLIKKILGENKYELTHAYSLSESLESINKYRPNVVLLDINLGKESGFDALKEIDTVLNSNIIMMSSDAFDKNVRRAMTLGASDFIAKPLVNKTLIQKVKKAFLKIDNELNYVILPEEEEKNWRCLVNVNNCVIDEKTEVLVSDSISLLQESISLNNKKYKRLGIPKKLKNGQIKTILSLLEDSVSTRDEFSNSLTYDQEDLLKESKITVYALDDDQNFLDIIKLFCSKNNIHIETFSDIKTLQTALRPPLPQLCIIDLSIEKPNDSFELIEKIRRDYEDLPIIAATSNTDGKSSSHAVEIGADDFIYKPLKKNLLIHKILGLVHDEELSSIYHRQILSRSDLESNSVHLYVEVKKIDEIGIYFLIKSQLKLGSNIILRPLKIDKEIKIKVTQSRYDDSLNQYYCYGEFQGLEYPEIFSLIGSY